MIGGAERSGQRRARFVEERAGLRLIEGALFLEIGDLGLHVGPDRAVGAALVERRAGDDLRRLVDHEVEREARWPHARHDIAFRDLDELPHRPS